MAKVNFQDALDTKIGDIERPPLVPQGTYTVAVAKVPTYTAVGKDDQYQCIDFVLKIIAATDDVDEEDLANYGDVTKSSVRKRDMFDTEDKNRFAQSMFSTRRFLQDHLGVEGNDDTPIKKLLADCVNHQCLATITWRPDNRDPEIMYLEVKGTAPVNE